MKEGKTIEELAAEIERQAKEDVKRDYVWSTTRMEMTPAEEGVKLTLRAQNGGEDYTFGVNDYAHEQIGARLDIPRKYYDRMLTQEPQLLAVNVNHWLQKNPDNRLVRTMDGNVRAFLSNRFNILDNKPIAQAVLPVLAERKGIQILSCELTERRMYIQAVHPRIQGEVKVGEIVQMGVIIGNSEVGAGAVRVQPLIYKLACKNGMIRAHAIRKYHIGRRLGEEGEDLELESFYRMETVETATKAFLLKVQDTVRHSFDEIAFAADLEKFREAAGIKIESANLQEVCKEVTKKLVLTKDEGDNVLKFLIEGGDLSQWGLANAVTATANVVNSYDRAVDLERLGGTIVDLPPSDWKVISRAGA